MDGFVKQFIEKNIDLIESKNWFEFFLTWERESEKIWPDINEVVELNDVLEYSGVATREETKQARCDVITKVAQENIEKILNNKEHWSTDFIQLSHVRNDLSSELDLKAQPDLLPAIVKAFNNVGLTEYKATADFGIIYPFER